MKPLLWLKKLLTELPSEFLTSSMLVMFVRVLNVSIVFGLSVLLLRILGLSEFGLFATYQAIMALAVLPMTAGFPSLIVRETSNAFAEGDLDQVRGTLRALLRIVAAYVLLAGLVIVAVSQWSPDWLTRPLLFLLWLHIVLQILAAVRSAVLRAAGHIVRGQLLERLIQPLLTISLNLVALAVLGASYGLTAAVCALLAAHAVTLVWGTLWVHRHAVSKGPATAADHKVLLRDGTKISGAGLLSSLLINGLVLATTAISSAEATGLYRIASAVAQPLLFVHEAAGQVAAPKLARFWATANYAAAASLLKISVLASVLIAGFGAFGLFLFGGPIIGFVYGPQAHGALEIALVIALAHCANASGGLDQEMLYMAGFTKQVLVANLIIVPASFILALVSLPSFGGVAAASALLFYHLATTIWISAATTHKTGMNPSITSILWTSSSPRFKQ